MKKYLVDLYLPSIGKHYDVYLSAGKTVSESTGLLVEIAESLTGGSYKGTEHSVLLDAETGMPLHGRVSVYDAGIRNSSRLILI